MKNKTLSICIATYNRANFIGYTLDSIVTQITDDVEIIIVDGASTDNTEDIVNDFIIKYSHIRYIKLQHKGGVDQDYSIAVEHAKGKMCFLFTDDDYLKPGSLKKIIELCSLDYSLIILNSEVRDCTMKNILTSKMLKLEKDLELIGSDLNTLFFNVMPYISFIGSIIIDRQEWEARNKSNYFNTEFIHVGVIFQKPFNNNILIRTEIDISIRHGNAQWSQRSYEIWIIKWPKLIQSFNLISYKNKKSYISSSSLRRYRDILVQRSKRAYNYHMFKKWHLKENTNIIWKVLLLFSSFIPVYLLKIIISRYLKIKKIDNLNNG